MSTAVRERRNAFVEFNKWDPHRSLRWRYDRAAYLAKTRGEGKTTDYSRDDKYINTTYKFLKEWRGLTRASQEQTDEARKARLYLRYQGLYAAYLLFLQKGDDPIRFEIEARILAKQSNEEIAKKVATHPAAIEWYEKVFFNVRDRLENEGYIGRYVIGPAVAHGLRHITLDFSAKYWGYYAGPYMLDLILSQYDPATPFLSEGTNVKQFMDEYWNKAARIRSVNSINAFDVNQFNVLQLFELHANLINQAHAAAEATGGAQTPYEEVLSGVMNTVQWSVGRSRRKALEGSPLKPYLGQSVELRASEMLDVAAGKTVDVSHTESVTFPPPRKSDEDEDIKQGS